METEQRIILNEVSIGDFEKSVKQAEEALKKLSKEIGKIDKTISKLDPQTRFFLCDAITGAILNSSKLPSYLLSAIASKYFVFGLLPHFAVKNQNGEKKVPNYIG